MLNSFRGYLDQLNDDCGRIFDIIEKKMVPDLG